MSNAVAVQNGATPGEIMERVIAAGDLSKLTPEQRAHYVVRVCETAGMNPLTKPFDLITLNGKLTLYATKGATDQLRKIHGITLRVVEEKRIEDVYQVRVEATAPDGRVDTDIGVVALGSLKGDALANALMKALTKAKRRVTLSICGLGLLDETELETIPAEAFGRREDRPEAGQEARAVGMAVDPATGEIAPTKAELGESIKGLRELLGWSVDDVRREAKEHDISLNTLQGCADMVDLLSGYAYDEAQRREDGEEQAILNADWGEVQQPARDWTE